MAAAGEGGVRRDMWEQEYRTASPDCAAALDEHYAHTMNFGRGRGPAVLRAAAAAADPTCALASALAALYVAPRDPARATALLAAAANNLVSVVHTRHSAFSALIGEEKDEDVAIERHFELLEEFPRDLMSLKRAQLICFYSGRPDTSLKFVEQNAGAFGCTSKQVLPENQDQNYIYGMLAFPLLELGRIDEAERAARKGLAINKNDCWSQHNQECRFKEATEFMKSSSPSWAACSSFMITHNWWHVAVCYLEGESPTWRVLEVYLNALGLLLRLYIRGKVDLTKDRLAALLDAFKNKVLVSLMDTKRQQVMQKAIQLAEAVYEYGKGEHNKVFEIMGPDFDALNCKMIGASDEQVDVFNEVWYTVLINAGEISSAIEVLGKQTRRREGAPFLWHLLEKAYSLDGRAADASVASKKADALQAAYFQ
ncbi:hypothetical protein ABZP36_005906 [Zizania latifolia]